MPNSRAHKEERSKVDATRYSAPRGLGSTAKSMVKMTTEVVQSNPVVKAVTDKAAAMLGAHDRRMSPEGSVVYKSRNLKSHKPGPDASKPVKKTRKLPKKGAY